MFEKSCLEAVTNFHLIISWYNCFDSVLLEVALLPNIFYNYLEIIEKSHVICCRVQKGHPSFSNSRWPNIYLGPKLFQITLSPNICGSKPIKFHPTMMIQTWKICRNSSKFLVIISGSNLNYLGPKLFKNTLSPNICESKAIKSH